MAWGRKCELGCETWPNHKDYHTCPVCHNPTKRVSGVQPLDDDAAKLAKSYAEFEDYYMRRELASG